MDIILIPKQGFDPKDPNNYHPITLLEVPGKILGETDKQSTAQVL